MSNVVCQYKSILKEDITTFSVCYLMEKYPAVHMEPWAAAKKALS